MVKDSDGLTKPPRCVDVACWISEAKQNMKKSTLVNAWMLDNIEYFPCTSPEVDVPPAVNVPMGEDATYLISDMEVGSDDDAGALVGVV